MHRDLLCLGDYAAVNSQEAAAPGAAAGPGGRPTGPGSPARSGAPGGGAASEQCPPAEHPDSVRGAWRTGPLQAKSLLSVSAWLGQRSAQCYQIRAEADSEVNGPDEASD